MTFLARLDAIGGGPRTASPARPARPAQSRAPEFQTTTTSVATPSTLRQALVTLGAPTGRSPVFLDTETTGIAGGGVVPFVVGLAWDDGEVLQTKQWTLDRLGGEVAMLRDVLETLARLEPAPLATFNGASFDLPLLRARTCRYRLAAPELEAPHLDLLHVARRFWKGRTPDCKLTTLERAALGIVRRGDIPSAEIPEVFWTWMRAPDDPGAQARLQAVRDHNLADIVNLAALSVELARHVHAPEDLDRARRAARHLFRLGLEPQARACLVDWVELAVRARRPSRGELRDAALELATLHRRAGERERAAPLWRWAWRADPRDPCSADAWAKHLEHHVGDFAEALRVAEGSRLPCPHRIARLQARLANASVQPSPVQPSPVQPSPVQSSPVQPSPVQPSPVQPAPVATVASRKGAHGTGFEDDPASRGRVGYRLFVGPP